MKTLVEVCVGSMQDIRAAVEAGADRVELCGGLELGGVTPSAGLVELAVEAGLAPVVVMVRPRAGGFRYDRDEFDAMLRDVTRFVALGAAGVVFGVLDAHGEVDVPRCRELVAAAGTRDTVFHRASDFVADCRRGLDAVIEAGVTRVLTSGGQPNAAAGCGVLQTLIEHAQGRIEILPGGGIHAGNVARIVQQTRCRGVHMGAATRGDDGSLAGREGVELVDRRFLSGASFRTIDGAAVAAAIAALQQIDRSAERQ
ncbi:MAG: copper homeostasis protein CutC [Planctomycetales bacterium]|nr:copper homeostasis protein CutC [Planctomycetales bacterium]